MTAFQIPDIERFEFKLPGDKATYSIPSLLDLPEDKIATLVALRGFDSSDVDALKMFSDTLAALAGDEDTEQAIRKMSIRQKVAFVEAYMGSSDVDPGESSAS